MLTDLHFDQQNHSGLVFFFRGGVMNIAGKGLHGQTDVYNPFVSRFNTLDFSQVLRTI